MSALAKARLAADPLDYYEVRDLLSGEVIGRISALRANSDGALRRALEQHGFRLVASRDERPVPRLRLTAA